MSKSLQINALENGQGIQYLLDAASKIFCNPILVHDTNYDLIAYAGDAPKDPIWNEIVTTGTVSMATQEFYARELFTENIANADKLVLLKSNALKHDRITAYVFNRDSIKVAVLAIVAYDTPFDQEDMEVFGRFADKISCEIRHDEYFNAFGRAYHESIINKLLDRVIENSKLYTPHVQILYDDFSDYLHLAVVDVMRGRASRGRLAYFKNLLENKYRAYKFAIYSNYIVVITSSKDKVISKEQFFGESDAFFKQNDLVVGISRGFENLYNLREYYNETVAALKEGIENNGRQRFFCVKKWSGRRDSNPRPLAWKANALAS